MSDDLTTRKPHPFFGYKCPACATDWREIDRLRARAEQAEAERDWLKEVTHDLIEPDVPRRTASVTRYIELRGSGVGTSPDSTVWADPPPDLCFASERDAAEARVAQLTEALQRVIDRSSLESLRGIRTQCEIEMTATAAAALTGNEPGDTP